MKVLGYIWTVLLNLVTLAIIIGIYDNIYEAGSLIIVSILILVYLSINIGFASIAWMHVEKSLIDYNRFKEIKKSFDIHINAEDTEYEKEELEKVQKQLMRNKVKYYINAVFNFLFYIIAVANLLDVIN